MGTSAVVDKAFLFSFAALAFFFSFTPPPVALL